MKHIFPILIVLSLIFLACRRDEPVAASGVALRFSTDTVFLDTVFSTVGSSTYLLKVYNPSDENVVVDDIRLGGGEGSSYRLNVDGTPGKVFKNVEILSEDSIYIFIEITSTSSSSQGFLYEDSVMFNNKGIDQNVKLVTLVRDAYFHFPDQFIVVGNTFIPYSVIDCNETWTDDKPHVIYGYALVDDGCVLNITTGADIHFYSNSGLWVGNGGSLRVGDNASAPGGGDTVTFSGDRLEPFYEDVPGQWGGALGGIFLQGGSVNNSIQNAVIKNATTALRLDSSATKNLDIQYSYILNSSRTGILGGFGNMEAHSLVVANAGVHLFYAFGGSYSFRQCTFANYWNQSTRTSSAVSLSNFLDVQDATGAGFRIVRDLSQCYFGNCIITGNNQQELSIFQDPSGVLNYQVENAILKVDTDPLDRGFDLNDQSIFQNILINVDPGFINTDLNRYALDSTSQAVNQGNGNISIGIPLDILGFSRNFNSNPDLGAFERQY